MARSPGELMRAIDPKTREVMRGPVITTAVLLALLAVNLVLGTTIPFSWAGYAEIGVAAIMVMIVLAFSMELLHASPLVRLFSILGFFWLAILFGITMIDYLTR